MIIITGASKGIGEFLFKSYLKNNEEQLIGTYFNTKPKENIEMFAKIDVCNLNQIQDFVLTNTEKLRNITLINCAAITYDKFMHKSDPEQWEDVIKTNLLGTYNFIRSFLPIMREQEYGRIINFSSVVAIKPTPGVSAYATSKSALWGLSKSVAIENAAFNITINNINLGYTELGMTNIIPDEYKNKILAQIPSGTLCEPIDILNTVNYIRTTKYLTGSSIDLSGGII